ncbi:ORF1007 [White spot syndrome virus]|uniref:ORF1007 n=1 Tax=White spot syndrome virus TaxID=342409 RepID=A0A2D3I6T9_9VIRU|nr:ORF1007 [White spot syndrome virus]
MHRICLFQLIRAISLLTCNGSTVFPSSKLQQEIRLSSCKVSKSKRTRLQLNWRNFYLNGIILYLK